MNQENIYQLISILLEHKKYYNFRKLDKYFYPSGKFVLNDKTILAFHNAFGIYVSTTYDYYLWTVLHEYLANKNLIHDNIDHKHILSDNELMIPQEIRDEIYQLLEGTGIDLMPYCFIEKKQLFLLGGNLQLDNYIESNVKWLIN